MGRHRLRPTLRHVIRQPNRIAGDALDADAAALIALMSPEPDATRQTLINDTIVALKNAGIWAKLDELWFTAAHSQQAGLLGWKRNKNLTAVNAPTFTTDRGIAGNGTSSYLNTNFVPSSDGVQYTLNDASLGVYSRTNSAAAVRDMDARNASTANASGVVLRWTDNKQYTYINNGSSGNPNADVGNSLGLGVSRRTSSTAQQAYRNGAQIAATSIGTSQNRPSVSLFLGASNNNGTPADFSTRQYAFAFVGGALSAQEQSDLYSIVHTTYLTAIGANV